MSYSVTVPASDCPKVYSYWRGNAYHGIRSAAKPVNILPPLFYSPNILCNGLNPSTTLSSVYRTGIRTVPRRPPCIPSPTIAAELISSLFFRTKTATDVYVASFARASHGCTHLVNAHTQTCCLGSPHCYAQCNFLPLLQRHHAVTRTYTTPALFTDSKLNHGLSTPLPLISIAGYLTLLPVGSLMERLGRRPRCACRKQRWTHT